MPLEIRLGVKPSREDLTGLLAQYSFGRYCENPRLPIEKSRAHEQWLLERAFARPETLTVSAWSDGGLQGLLVGRLSAWDSEHFGFPMASMDALLVASGHQDQERWVASRLAAAFDQWCRNQAVRFASVRLPSRQFGPIQALEDVGYRYVESYIYNVVDLDRLEEPKGSPAPLRYARPEEREIFRRWAPGAFATQRFHADSRFDREKAETLYLKWIDSAFDDPGRHILVMEEDGRAAAFMVYRDEDFRATLGLRSAALNMGLLDPAARGKGVGTRFYHALFHWFRHEGFDIVESGLTMRNQASLNWHNKTGFRIVGTYVTLHRWLDAP